MGDGQGGQSEIVAQEDQPQSLLGIATRNAAQKTRITIRGQDAAQPNRLIAAQSGGSFDRARSVETELVILLGAGDEERTSLGETIEPGEVHISAVEEVKRSCFEPEFVEKVDVVDLAAGHLNTGRNAAPPELIIRELKYAYALGKLPTSGFQANVAFFQIVMLAHNLLNRFKRLCAPPHLRRATLQRLRQRLLVLPVRLVRPGGLSTLRLPMSHPGTREFMETMERIHGLSPSF